MGQERGVVAGGIVIQITNKYRYIRYRCDAHANQNLQLLFELIPLHFHFAIYFVSINDHPGLNRQHTYTHRQADTKSGNRPSIAININFYYDALQGGLQSQIPTSNDRIDKNKQIINKLHGSRRSWSWSTHISEA